MCERERDYESEFVCLHVCEGEWVCGCVIEREQAIKKRHREKDGGKREREHKSRLCGNWSPPLVLSKTSTLISPRWYGLTYMCERE